MKYTFFYIVLVGLVGCSVRFERVRVGDCYEWTSGDNYKVTKILRFGVEMERIERKEPIKYETFGHFHKYYDQVDCESVSEQ
jgi:hypothetical protein